jgi:hypothetical protein
MNPSPQELRRLAEELSKEILEASDGEPGHERIQNALLEFGRKVLDALKAEVHCGCDGTGEVNAMDVHDFENRITYFKSQLTTSEGTEKKCTE